MKALTDSHKSRMKQASTKSTKNFPISPEDTNADLKIVATELASAYHTAFPRLIYEQSKVTFTDSKLW